MGRKPDPGRKPELLGAICSYLGERGIGELSLRPLAAALGVSTYSLVYHFGSKEQLLGEVVAHVEERQRAMIAGWRDESIAGGLRRYWRWSLEPSSRRLLRISFEAALMDGRAPGRFDDAIASLSTDWIRFLGAAFRAAGVSRAEARREATLLAATVFGLQLDLLMTGDERRLGDAVEALASRLDAALPASEQSGARPAPIARRPLPRPRGLREAGRSRASRRAR